LQKVTKAKEKVHKWQFTQLKGFFFDGIRKHADRCIQCNEKKKETMQKKK
jgi:hypothetical protein